MPDAILPPLIAALQAHLNAERVETHISWVLLTPTRAFKIKKSIRLAFLDYSTLEKREAACRLELALNRRFAPRLYLAVRSIGGTPDAPLWDAEPAIEWVVEMQRFDSCGQLDQLCARGGLHASHLSELARYLSDFQHDAPVASPASPHGQPAQILAQAEANFAALHDELRPSARMSGAAAETMGRSIESLARWTREEFQRIKAVLQQRQNAGFIREGHGDLHLGNLVLQDGLVTPFDGIEFNADLRWIDVANDIAFTWVDLLLHRQPGLAAGFISAWREASNDLEALRVMRFYAVYRALVRAKVAVMRAAQEVDEANPRHDIDLCRDYLRLAEAIAVPPAPTLGITVGLSGAGKTHRAHEELLASANGMLLCLRSDVERKRLFGLPPLARPGPRIYHHKATRATYAKLREAAHTALGSGWSVIVDAAFLRRDERESFRALAESLGLAFHILECQADTDELRRRLRSRALANTDASDATEAVLAPQMAWFEALTVEEREYVVRVLPTAAPP